ncbi:MAG TPA: hypothetical protein ENO10_04300 [Salinimicrobium catena]|uniref:Rhodanese domain-containing protein n=1 Tax=Salinimicrobium catena TaxID=390640 RepID=A0A7C2M254_9FLAO|nr:hypothetical protein [Salinimicrobium catena]
MKELEKVKRISISSTLFILAVLVGLLMYERPENMYAVNAKKTLENLTNMDYFMSMEKVRELDVALVDIRSPFEFEMGHLENAINIPAADILKEENKAVFQEYKASEKLVVLYGKNVEEANIPFLLLYQLGYDNLKLLNVENTFLHDKMITQPTIVEKPIANIRAFIDESVKNSNKKGEVKEIPVPKRIVTIKKKKKKPVEGGC